MTTLQDIFAAVNWNIRVTENFESVAPAGLYGIRRAGFSGLTFAYYGGEFNGVTVANGTVNLTASSTNYVVAHRTTGVVTAATNTTNWNNATTYMQLYEIVAGASSFTLASTSDKRQAFGSGGGGGGSGMSNPMTTVGDIIVGGTVTSGVAAPSRLAMGTSLQVLRVNSAGTNLEYATPSSGSAGLTWNAQTASYTLALGDANNGVEMLVASANNLTVPLNSSVAFPVGTSILIYQAGAGLTTIAATGGVTIVKRGSSLALGGQYALATLVKRATDTWILSGDIAP